MKTGMGKMSKTHNLNKERQHCDLKINEKTVQNALHSKEDCVTLGEYALNKTKKGQKI